MSGRVNLSRRRFFSTTVMTIAAAQLGVRRSAHARLGSPKGAPAIAMAPGPNGTNT
jgi:hypothetical protein